jgi:hypothetical protein
MATGNSANSVEAGELDSEQAEWLRAHEALSRLAKERARADAEEGRWLLAALRSATHVHLGFGSFAEYIERTLGYKPRSTQESESPRRSSSFPSSPGRWNKGLSTGLVLASLPALPFPRRRKSGSRQAAARPCTSSKRS